MKINLSPEMIQVVRAVLRSTPRKQLIATSRMDRNGDETTGEDALDLFEDLYQNL